MTVAMSKSALIITRFGLRCTVQGDIYACYEWLSFSILKKMYLARKKLNYVILIALDHPIVQRRRNARLIDGAIYLHHSPIIKVT